VATAQQAQASKSNAAVSLVDPHSALKKMSVGHMRRAKTHSAALTRLLNNQRDTTVKPHQQ
jgi:hypothetical protein